ncbi:restriction endonuclease subunit S [Mesosutterella multiformis]|nr:restriction endonuclease subunit S [Mesosutterella multiformis]GCB31117.1 hypothetical protein KGMB02707_03860 [Mesosutterella multiformis]
MQEKAKEPEIRFAGFTGAWEQRELGEISEIKTGPFGSSLHASDYVADGVPIITTEHFKFGSIEKNKYLIPMVSDTDHSRLIAYSLKTGDIVFSRVGSVDINALVEPESDGWLFSGRVLRVRSSEKYDSGFLHNLLETDDVRNDIRNRAVGQTMPSINTQILSATELTIPSSKREQQRIGNFFKGINQLLTLHQRKYEKLLNIKKSMLEKMFPKEGEVVPEIRFKGFTGAWEQRKVKDLAANTYGGGTPLTSNPEFWEGSIPWIQSSDLSEHNLFRVHPRKFISHAAVANSSVKIIPENSIAVITRVGVGKLAVMSFPYTTSQDFLSLSNLNTDVKFTSYQLYRRLQKDLNAVQGTSIKGITKEELLGKIFIFLDVRNRRLLESSSAKLILFLPFISESWKCLKT